MITIKAQGGENFNYTKYLEQYFKSAGPGNPEVFETKEIGLTYEDDKIVDLFGKDFAYDFQTHVVSGTLERMAFGLDGKTQLAISGLDFSNPYADPGELHELVAALMGGGQPGAGGNVDAAFVRAMLASEAQHFVGGKGNDTYVGTDHDDLIEGGKGKDKLAGGDGDDTFVLNATPGAANADKIRDFDAGADQIELSKKIFDELGGGKALKEANFVVGTEALDSDDHVIYDAKSGALYYDADGAGGEDAVRIATLSKNLDLSHTNFLLG
jgi:Ca2+-binding RTX toxin-like protein